MKSCLFLDRDGVINVDYGFVCAEERLDFVPGIFEICRYFQKKKFLIIIITNQSGISRNYFTDSEFHSFMEIIIERFKGERIQITDYYYCPHHPLFSPLESEKACLCRKPNSLMFQKAVSDYDIDVSSSVNIGDNLRDIEAGLAIGILNNFILSDHSDAQSNNCGLNYISDLQEIKSLQIKK
jgi:D-glycero-D-manno-heptose 1,7-bisphosphate phosphatase